LLLVSVFIRPTQQLKDVTITALVLGITPGAGVEDAESWSGDDNG
jgi:hypothetical protein